ncbi:MAG: TrkH family potassium uptake protein [Sporichthyaceae bacterium]
MSEGSPGAQRKARRERRVRERLAHPARIIATAFAVVVLTGTALLMLPFSTADGESPHLIDALFTATSASCVAGLAIVDTGGHWSTFGELVILILMQVGGLGIMTLATLIALVVSRRMGLRHRLLIQAETKALNLADLRRVLRAILAFSVGTELVVASILTLRFALGHDYGWGRAIYHGVFHAVAAFNNGGLALYPDSMSGFVDDPIVSVTIALAVLLGGIGYLVVFELTRTWRRPREWSVLTKLTLGVSGVLLVIGVVLITAAEWSNQATFGPLSVGDKLSAGFFASVMPRSGGLNSVPTGEMTSESLLTQTILMFIGGGSAGTAGGIKVTTFGLLAFVIWAEMRGESGVHIGRRRIAEANQRQALAIALMSIGIVMSATLLMLHLTTETFERVLFEVTSAFGTVGLSTGITPGLGRDAHLLLIVLMFIGRIGPLTLASALALRERDRRFELPEERTIVG